MNHTILKIYHHSTSFFRSPPQFIIIGTEKGGTETLYNQLSQHPNISLPLKSSIHYFEAHWNKSDLWYRAHFPFFKKNLVTGEKSTFYMYDPRVAERIKITAPNVKIIALLRNPTDRAISHYFHYKKRGYETRSIEDAFEVEKKRISPYLNNLQESDLFPAGHPLKVYSYKSRGYYAEQLEHYFSAFPRENIHIIESESYFQNPQKILKDTFSFLNIDPDYTVEDLKPRNTGDQYSVPPEFYRKLEQHYIPHNIKLEKQLNRKFSWNN